MAREAADAVGYIEMIEILVGSFGLGYVGRVLKEPAPRRESSDADPRKGKPLCLIQRADRRIDDQQEQIDDHFPHGRDTETRIG